MPSGNVLQVATATESIASFTALVTSAVIQSVYTNEDASLTVFAPSNVAIDALPDGVLRYYLANIDQLANVLLYHTINGTITSSELTDGLVLTTKYQETIISINRSSNNFVLVSENGETANITTRNLQATNGILHIIDSVLLPPSSESDDGYTDKSKKKGDSRTLIIVVIIALLFSVFVCALFLYFAFPFFYQGRYVCEERAQKYHKPSSSATAPSPNY